MRDLILRLLAECIEIHSAMGLYDCIDAPLRKKTNAKAFEQVFDEMVQEGLIETYAPNFDEEPAFWLSSVGCDKARRLTAWENVP